ncbi:hypothetical protein B0H19DRAFT_1266188 [Mycena capillaripes]|nr:hypothetical protein B0H19DRAFT_1266188 [Mycena capillaripes]
MDDAHIQPYIHDTVVQVVRYQLSGAVYYKFRCFFKRHHLLPHNNPLNVQGDLVIMRVDDDNIRSVVDMVPAERVVADFVAQQFAILLHHFQSPRRTLIHEIYVEMP